MLVNPEGIKRKDLIRHGHHFGVVSNVDEDEGVLAYQYFGESCYCVNVSIRQCKKLASAEDENYKYLCEEAEILEKQIKETLC